MLRAKYPLFMRIRLSKGGRLSLPTHIRRRWATDSLVLEDRGDRVILRPIPQDAITRAVGAFASKDMTSSRARDQMRREEQEAQNRKYPR